MPLGGGRHRRRHGSKSRKSRARLKKYLIWVGAVAGALILLVGGYGVYTYVKLNGNLTRTDALDTNDAAIKNASGQEGATNFLILGSDSREGANSEYGDTGGARSDTTLLAHIAEDQKQVILISIPRDAWVDIPACERENGSMSSPQQNSFNAAFSVGGAKCTVRTIQMLTGIRVDHYVQIDFMGFRSMVDALGGVEICSPEEVFDKDSGLKLVPGDQTLNGEQALAYMRARHAFGDGSDLNRIQRQQQFLGAMMRTATTSDVLLNPKRLTDFLNAATSSLTVDNGTNLRDLANLARSLHGLDPARVQFVTPPIANRDYEPPGSGQKNRVLLDAEAGQALYDAVIDDREFETPPDGDESSSADGRSPAGEPSNTAAPAEQPIPGTQPASDVSVQVLNATGQSGLASQAAMDLQDLGFTVTGSGNAELVGVSRTVIRYAPSAKEQAETLADVVPGAVLEEDSALGSTVVLELGETFSGVRSGTGSGESGQQSDSAPVLPPDAVNAAEKTCG